MQRIVDNTLEPHRANSTLFALLATAAAASLPLLGSGGVDALDGGGHLGVDGLLSHLLLQQRHE